ncbi:MAG: hotdog fold domain-containing protein [Brevibacterium yomogidense]
MRAFAERAVTCRTDRPAWFWSARSDILVRTPTPGECMSESAIKRAYGRLKEVPLGHRIFGTAVTLKAPYFRTIRPRFVSLEPGRGEVKMFDRWAVRNHIGTVHAIACCNLAELVAGTTLDISLPDSHRWIPKGMSVAYLKKAKGELTGVATVEDLSAIADDEAREVIVNVDITDRSSTVVVHADITMWISPK